MAQFQVGNYVTGHPSIGDYKVVEGLKLTGIVYEVNWGTYRMQLADGTKVRDVKMGSVEAASPEEIKAYEAQAVEGMNPDAIIQREKDEKNAPYESDGSEDDKEEDDDKDDK
jgi:hypothetical protein